MACLSNFPRSLKVERAKLRREALAAAIFSLSKSEYYSDSGGGCKAQIDILSSPQSKVTLTETWLAVVAWNSPWRLFVSCLGFPQLFTYRVNMRSVLTWTGCSMLKTRQELYSSPPLSRVSGLLDVMELALLLENSPA